MMSEKVRFLITFLHVAHEKCPDSELFIPPCGNSVKRGGACFVGQLMALGGQLEVWAQEISLPCPTWDVWPKYHYLQNLSGELLCQGGEGKIGHLEILIG